MSFTSFNCNTPRDKNLLALGSLEVFKSSQPYPRFPPLNPAAKVSSPAARWSTGWQTSDRESDWAHHGVVGGGSSAGGVAGERRRHRGNTAAAVRSLAREQVGLGNVLHTWLLGTLGKVIDELVGSGSRGEQSSPMATRRRPQGHWLR
jgi:hypothetical protein